MNRIILNITCELDKVPNIDVLLPKEFARGEELKQEDILEHLLIKDNRMGAVLVLKNVDEEGAKKIATSFPLFKHFDIEYINVDKLY